MEILIREAREFDSYSIDVEKLADRNKSTLGFFPRSVLMDHIRLGLVLVAIHSDAVVGYVLFRHVKRREAIAITHLCVAEGNRGSGVARSLIEALSGRNPRTRGLSALCRSDYEATTMWPKLGFTYRGDVPGRAKGGSTLCRWWRDHGHGDLFSSNIQEADDRWKAAIDNNVLIDLLDQRTDGKESAGLLADWLLDDLELLITPEANNEVQRITDPAARERRLLELQKFRQLEGDPTNHRTVLDVLLGLLPEAKNHQDESDYRHLAWAIAGGADAFLTRDGALLDASPILASHFPIAVLHPADYIRRLDAVRDPGRYADSRVGGTRIARIATPTTVHEQHYAPFVHTQSGERRANLVRIAREKLANPTHADVKLVYGEDDTPLALLVWEWSESVLTISIARMVESSVTRLMAAELVAYLLREARTHAPSLCRLVDQHVSLSLKAALADAGFSVTNSSILKLTLDGILPLAALRETLNGSNMPSGIPEEHYERISKLTLSAREGSLTAAAELETRLWPLKLSDSAVETFIIPIQPQWALQLFDQRLSDGTLFGGDPTLLLKAENAYYRAARGPLPVPGDRVFWYVSSRMGVHGSGAIRAMGRITESANLRATEAYLHGRRYGIYGWNEVLRLAHGNQERPVMILFFNAVEELKRPITFRRVQQLLLANGQSKNQLQTSVKINSGVFQAIYSEGMEGR